MGKVDLQLLKDELKIQVHSYRFNKPSVDILDSYARINSAYTTPATPNIDFESIISAKNEWETCVDSLEYQAIIMLDDDLNVIRANRTIELWGWGDVNKIAGTHILDLIKPALDNDDINDWIGEWCQIDTQTNAEWESNDLINGKSFHFSFYPNRDIESIHHDIDSCYAVLLISDISNRKSRPSKNNCSDLDLDSLSPEQSLNDKLKDQAEKRLHQLAEQLINSKEYERKRVSSELHDGVGQILSALKYQVEAVVIDSQNSSHQRKNDIVLNNILDNIKVALSELRRISVNLRPSIIDELGLLMTLRWFTGEFNKVYTELNVELQLDVSESDISDEYKHVIYRIVQESMNNAAKYSGANKIIIQLIKSDIGLLLRVSDNGCGFNVHEVKAKKNSGLGLNSMEERATEAGADFTLSSSSSLGTTINVLWKMI